MSARNTPSGGRAVKENRAPAVVENDDAVIADWRRYDWFATPPFASRAGAELIRQIDPDARSAWEPACGDGIMAECLLPYFNKVMASDVAPRGYGDDIDFFVSGLTDYDWLITNPPFNSAAEFVRRGLKVVRRGVAVLCRLAFLETVDRYALHFSGDHPLSVLAPFCERVPMQLGPWNPKCSTATAYAWFIYEKTIKRQAPIIMPIAPGARSRLSMPDDIRRFVKTKADAGLFRPRRERTQYAVAGRTLQFHSGSAHDLPREQT